MASVKIQGNASGTGVFTITAPNSNTDRTLTLPDNTGTVVSTASTPTFTGAATAPAFIPNSSTVPTDGLYLPAASTVALSTGTTERMRIDSSGNVGIGVTPNNNKFIVKGAHASGRSIAGIQTSESASGSVLYFGFYNSSDSRIAYVGSETSTSFQVWNGENTPTIFGTNNTERARITSGGDLLVGTTTITAKFNITNGSEQQISQYINNTNSSPVGVQIRYATDVNATSNRFIDCIGNATSRFIVYSNGNAVNTNGSYGTISDIKLKQDITDASSQWDDIKALRVVKYRLKNEVVADPNYPSYIGLIAQEAEQVSPGLVDDCVDDNTGEVTKSVKYSILYMKAVKALQEAMERIETLEAQNAAFEARLAALEAK